MRLVLTGIVVFCALTLQAQESDTIRKSGPVKLAFPTPGLWSHSNLTGIPDTTMLPDTIPVEIPAPVLSDSMLWAYLYLDDILEENSLTIIGTGDIMLGTNYPSESYLPPGQDCSPLLRPVHGVIQSGDLLFGNLEGGFCSCLLYTSDAADELRSV